MKAAETLGVLLLLAGSSHCFPQGNGSDHSQNITTNNGVVVQVNVKPQVKRILTEQGAKAQLDERGWMRLLVPASEPTPETNCAIAKKQPVDLEPLTVFYGTNVGVCVAMNCTVVAGRSEGAYFPLITVHRVAQGLLVDARVFDQEGHIVASIVDDKPHINRNFVSDWDRPDEHSMWVKDNYDKQVLYVKLLNKNSLYIEGVFNLPNDARSTGNRHRSMEIDKAALTILPGHNAYNQSCKYAGPREAPMIWFDDRGNLAF